MVGFIAAFVNHGRWEPQGDDALIELRAREVGTERNPLIGQPSTSGSYGEKARNVAHPGPLGFVVLSPGTRLLGPVTGTLLSTAALNSAALLSIAFLVFRVGGPRLGLGAGVLAALAGFSAGAGGLVDPISSNFGRFALLAAAVGVWGLLAGDVRALPLTVAWWTFAAQQHLSVGPASAVVLAAGVVGVALVLWRPEPLTRKEVSLWLLVAIGVGLVLWGPVIYEQITHDPGNLSALSTYGRDSSRVDLGYSSAIAQVSQVLGPRPFLGRSQPTGWDLTQPRSQVISAVVLLGVAALVAAGAWWQRKDRRFLAATAMLAVMAAAGVLTGANIPDSPEQGRLNFYHWAFALSFFQLLIFGWLAARALGERSKQYFPLQAVTAVGLVVVLAATPLVVERRADRLVQPIPASAVRELLDQVRSSADLAALDGPVLMAVNGDDRYIQVGDTVGTRLVIEGRQVLFPPSSDGFVHPSRIINNPCAADHVLMISLLKGEVKVPPQGKEIARVDGAPGLDHDALNRLSKQAAGAPVDLGGDLQRALDALPGSQGDFTGAAIVFRLATAPADVLLIRSNLDLLIEHPIASPRLNQDDLKALRHSLPEGAASVVANQVAAHLMTKDEFAGFAEGC